MSDMSAAVILRLVDELSGPAKKAASSVKSLVKDLEKLKGLSGKSFGGANKQIAALTRDVRKATEATKGLRSSMAHPPTAGFTKAAEKINGVTSAANKAANAVRGLNRAMGRAGSGSGPRRPSGGSSGGHGGGGGRGARGGHGGFGAAGHFGRHVVRHALGTAAGLGLYAVGSEIAEGIAESVRAGMEQSFEKQHTVAMLRMQGEKMGDINAAVAQASRMTRLTPQFTSAQNLEAIAELRPALLGGIQEATKLAPMFQKSVAVLEAAKQGAGGKALAGVNTHGEALDLVRALEIKGETTRFGSDDGKNEANMGRYVDSITKAIVAFNGQLGAKDFHSAFKFARGDAANWSQEFSTEILPTIMNELKKSSKTDASQAGNALKSMSRAVVDNVMTPQAMGNWERLGMFDAGAIKKGKGGKDTVNPGGHMLGYQMFQENPYQWVQDYLLPHMKDHGIDIGNRKDVVAQLGGLFGNRVANQIAAILATQQAQIKKDQDNIRKATGTSGLDFLMNADPTARMQVFSAALKELGGAIGDLALPGNMRGMKGIIDWAHSATDAVRGSSTWKALGRHYEEVVAGFFHQTLDGLKGRGKDARNFYNDGAAVRSVIGNIKSLVIDLAAALAPAGNLHANIQAFADGVAQIRKAFEAEQAFENDPLGFIKDHLQTKEQSYKDASKQAQDAQDAPKKAAEDAARGAAIAKAKKVYQDAQPVLKVPPMVSPAHAKKMGLVHNPFGVIPSRESIMASSGGDVIADVKGQAASAAPSMQAAGAGMMTALADGIAGGGGAARGDMGALMAALVAIAAGGVTVPVKLDTSGAEAKLSALVSKANSIGGGTGKDGRYSKSLSDTGQ